MSLQDAKSRWTPDARFEAIDRVIPLDVQLREPRLMRVLWVLGAIADHYAILAEGSSDAVWQGQAKVAEQAFSEALRFAGGES